MFYSLPDICYTNCKTCDYIHFEKGLIIMEIKELSRKMNILMLEPIVFHDIKFQIINIKTVHHPNFKNIHLHRHSWFEFNYILEGCLYTKINNVEFLVSPGDSFIAAPGQEHSHRAYENSEYTDMCIQFKIEKLEHDSGRSLFDKFAETFNMPRPYSFQSDIEELACTDDLYTSQLKFLQWIFNLYNIWRTNDQSILSTDVVSSKIKEYLNLHYSEPFKSENLARALNMSYRHLSRLFKKENGVSIIMELTSIKMMHAKTLLLETNLPISEIAVLTGFENVYYFSTVFRSCFHVSPSRFRKMENYIEGIPRKYRKQSNGNIQAEH